MADVTLSSAVRTNLLSLQSTANALAKTQEKLATGLKVNSALDDPTAFFTASSLNSRANDLSRLQDFVGNSVQTIKAADEGIQAITKLVESAEATARQALNSASVNASVETSDLNTTPVVVGDDGKQFTVSAGGNTTADITINTGDDADAIATKINAALTAGSVDATATVGDDGKITIEAHGGEDLVVAEGTTTGGAAAIGLTAGTTEAAENSDRTAFAAQFNELRSQIDQLAADASYNGNNLLAGDSLTVTFNEDSTSSLTVSGVNFDSSGLGIDASSDTFQKDSDINAALDDLKAATDTLRAQASKFGSNLSVVETRQDFTKNLINVLETGAANLTLADTNEEGANLLALQTRQQLSSTSLSLASQADQNVLRLF